MDDHIRDSQKSPIYIPVPITTSTFRLKTNAHTSRRELVTNSIVKKKQIDNRQVSKHFKLPLFDSV
jgi:hypothetical protein